MAFFEKVYIEIKDFIAIHCGNQLSGAIAEAPLFGVGAVHIKPEAIIDRGRIKRYCDGIQTTIADECLTVPVSFTHDPAAFNAAKNRGYDIGSARLQDEQIHDVRLN